MITAHGEERELDDAPDALLRVRNSLLNMDGLGVAWYTPSASAYTNKKSGMRPALYKSQSPPTNDFNFRSLCENTESNCLLSHIHATSGSVVTPVNSHPFVFGRHAFMHNGVVSDFTKIRRVEGPQQPQLLHHGRREKWSPAASGTTPRSSLRRFTGASLLEGR